jgi:hypothetical protein
MNSEALLDRVNYALALSNGQVGGTNFDAGRLLALGTLTSRGFPTPQNSCAGADADCTHGQETALLLLENALLNGEVSATTQKAIRRQHDDRPGDRLAGISASLTAVDALLRVTMVTARAEIFIVPSRHIRRYFLQMRCPGRNLL